MKKSVGDYISLAATVVLVTCAVAVTTIAVRREFAVPPSQVSQRITRQSDWLQYAANGHRLGSPNAKAILIEFSDFQCPWCQKYDAQLRDLLKRHPNDFAVVYRHLPMTSLHPFAKQAAVASECSAQQGRFAQMHAVLFDGRDSIGKLPWSSFAKRSGVPDLKAFDRCLSDPIVVQRVERDSAAGAAVGARGTPTSLINGVRFSGGLPSPILDSIIKVAIGGARRPAA